MTRELADHHRELVEASAISPEVAAERGYWTATMKSELEVLGFSRAQRNVPALVIPIRNASGEVVNYQIRPDTPRINEHGKPLKYESPAGMPPTLDVPLRCREQLRSRHVPLWITEGARKADAAASAGLCCVSLPGVWSWARRLNADARRVLPDLQRVRLEERKVVVAFDSDVMVKRQVHAALDALGVYLRSQGALASFAYLPELEPGLKCGLDDFLAGHTVEDAWRHVEDELRPAPEPRDKPKRPAQPTIYLLGYVDNLLRRFVHFPNGGEHARLALSLYVLHTWAIGAATATPYIYVRSPQKRSGKTRLLETLELGCREPMRAASITEAALYQAVEAFGPTLLIDEVDALFSSRSERAEAIRGVLNGGNRRGASVIRGTQDGTPMRSEIFCAKVLAGIDTGKLPDTVRDRALVIDLERKTKSEPVERLRVADLGDEPAELRDRLADWAAENHEALAAYRCEPIPEISDRLEEGWEVLLAVASLAGDDVLTRARAAAIALAGADDADEDHGQVLLVALHGIFGDEDAMLTAEICKQLNNNDELPFGSYRRDEGISGHGLAKLLRPHNIRPKNVRPRVGEQGKGYEREWFASAWERYAPSVRAQGGAGEASQPSQRPTDAANGEDKADSAGTEVGRDEIPDASEPSHEDAGTDGTHTEPESVPNPSRPESALASGNGRVRDAGTDGTDDLPADLRAHTLSERERRAAKFGISIYDDEDA